MKKYLAITVLTASLILISATFTSAMADDFSFSYGGTFTYIPPHDDDDDLTYTTPPLEAQPVDSGPEVTLRTPDMVAHTPDSEPDVEIYPGDREVYGTIGDDDDTPVVEIPRDRFRRPDAYIDVSIPDADTDSDIDTDTDGGLDTSDPEEPITIIRDRYGDVRIPARDIPRIPDRTPVPDPSSDTDIDTDDSGSSDRTGGVAASGTCPDRPCCRTNCVSSDYAEVPAVIETTADWMAYTGNGGCSLAHTTGASNALPILILALSLVPMAIRRFRK